MCESPGTSEPPQHPSTDGDGDVEWAALELACRSLALCSDGDSFRRALQRADFRFSELIDQAIRHRLFPVLGYHLLTTAETQYAFPASLRPELRLALHANRVTVAAFRREAARVSHAFTRAGIDHAFTKGVILAASIYPDDGCRVMRDIDVLIAPPNRDVVTEIMRSLGYESGIYDWRERAIKPLPRNEQLVYRLNPDHLPHFVRLAEAGLQPYFRVDIANSFTWARSTWLVNVENGLASAGAVQGRDGIALPALSTAWHLLFLILHLFREAWFERTIQLEKPKLNQFTDIVLMWQRTDESARRELLEIVRSSGVEDPARWVLEHLDRLFATQIADELGLGGRSDPEWLASARTSNGEAAAWHGSMRRRLRARDKLILTPRPKPSHAKE